MQQMMTINSGLTPVFGMEANGIIGMLFCAKSIHFAGNMYMLDSYTSYGDHMGDVCKYENVPLTATNARISRVGIGVHRSTRYSANSNHYIADIVTIYKDAGPLDIGRVTGGRMMFFASGVMGSLVTGSTQQPSDGL